MAQTCPIALDCAERELSYQKEAAFWTPIGGVCATIVLRMSHLKPDMCTEEGYAKFRNLSKGCGMCNKHGTTWVGIAIFATHAPTPA